MLTTGPAGEIVASADDKEEASLLAEFDLDKIKSKRNSWGVFRDRRPELYKVLLTLDGNSPTVWDHPVSTLFCEVINKIALIAFTTVYSFKALQFGGG